MFADPLIVKVFFNLIDNAVRYGKKITTLRFYGEERGETMSLSAKMTGSGFRPIKKRRSSSGGMGRTPASVCSLPARSFPSRESRFQRRVSRARGPGLRWRYPKGHGGPLRNRNKQTVNICLAWCCRIYPQETVSGSPAEIPGNSGISVPAGIHEEAFIWEKTHFLFIRYY